MYSVIAMIESILNDNRLFMSVVKETLSGIQNKLDVHCNHCSKKYANIQKIMSTLSARTQELAASTKATTYLGRNVTELTNKLSGQINSVANHRQSQLLLALASSKTYPQLNLLNTDVVYVSGGIISDAKAAVFDLSEVTRDKCILVVGGNDWDTCETNDNKTVSPSAIIDDYHTPGVSR